MAQPAGRITSYNVCYTKLLRVESPPSRSRKVSLRICIFGAGAVGGHLAARFAAAGHEVSVFARGAHLEAMNARGIELRSGDEA